MNQNPPLELAAFARNLRSGIWLLGVTCWVFGLIDRSLDALADGYLSGIEITQILTVSFFLVGWLLLKPASLKFSRKINHSA
ncbi:hypothetical protein IQ268_02015 [Oculatella sp. LEGE 06141]|uniref:hypothetical protein n=1 Tax=Oculatella sp. LEGE 06141 TaxID=1828648 RepID=UPI00187E7A04|nr:hypothetical protein [Oculatella sp. LEGE 06141]MBE9177349.1 hypothetical protein [Oculatella sp. LEGE 06141]